LNINGKDVRPGDVIQYQLVTKPTLTGDLGNPVTSLGGVDHYSEYEHFTDEQKAQVIITDHKLGILPLADYTLTWDDDAHTMTFVLTGAGLKAITQAYGETLPSFDVTLSATVDSDIPTGVSIDNRWSLLIDDDVIDSNIVTNPTNLPKPSKDVTKSQASSVSIDGKTFLVGQMGTYTVSLDGKDLQSTAYPTLRFGMVDTPDTEHLQIHDTSLTVTAPDGSDVTEKFNAYWDGKSFYVAAKLHDTTIPATGKTIKSTAASKTGVVYRPNSVVTDIPSYLAETSLDPLESASIDPSLPGGTYEVSFDFTVVKAGDIANKAVEVFNGSRTETNTVTNKVADIDPEKDVVVNVGDPSIDGKSVYLNHLALYKLSSSTLPADRVEPVVTHWSITDELDPTYDTFTGQWAVYARSAFSVNGVQVTAGQKVAGSGFDSSQFGGDLFTASYDTATNVFTVSATQAYLDVASADSGGQLGWDAYLQFKRIKVSDHVPDQFTEHLGFRTADCPASPVGGDNAGDDVTYDPTCSDAHDTPSNEVWTRTPDQTPSMSIVKWDSAAGDDEQSGDRDEPEQALAVGDGDIVTVHITVTNTGKSPLAQFATVDQTVAGVGSVTDWVYPAGYETLVLQPGQSFDIYGTLHGLPPDSHHTDRADVTAKPVIPCVVDGEGQLGDDEAATDNASDAGTSDSADAISQTCYDTPIEQTDDWNSVSEPVNTVSQPADPLAVTGAGGSLVIVALSVVFSGCGAGMLALRRKSSTKPSRHCASVSL
jgi:adhesin isopeptide-forming family sspB-C2 type protein